MRKRPRILALALLTVVVRHMALAAGDGGPQPPCTGATFPPYPDLEHSPLVKVWDASGLGRDWPPPACTGWTTPGFSTLVTTVARFRHASGADGLRRRVEEVSRLAGMVYWSTSRQSWQTLISRACALSGPAADGCRRDFTADELGEGRSQYFEQDDNLFGKGIYRLRMRKVAAGALAFEIENASVVRFLMLPVFQPGEMQAVYFMERESQEIWRYYAMARTRGNAATLAAGHDASSINRAVALYRYLAGIRMDQEPPAAR
jgi:hypothetical protein